MSTITAVADGTGLPPGNEKNNPRNLSPPGDQKTSSTTELNFRETSVDISYQLLQFQQGSSSNPIHTLRQESLQADFRSVELIARRSTFQGGIMETASLLYRKASVNINISSTVLQRYAEDIQDMENISPELLQDYLALIKLLDDYTPDSFDPFFDRLRHILQGNPEMESLQKEAADINVNVPLNASASQEVQVREFFISIKISVTELSIKVERHVQKSDPLVLDLDGDGIEVTEYQQGREFDIDANGVRDTTSFVFGGDAFLALDRNGNGQIDDGSELFGDQNGAANGFLELSRFDENNDSKIDKDDSIFGQLRLFDGIQALTLSQAGVASINTLMSPTPGSEINSNQQLGYSSFMREDGSQGIVSDMLLNFIS